MTVNVGMVGDNVAMAPSFPGCQPCRYTSNNQTLQPDADQVDKGFALISSLDASQQQQAVRGLTGLLVHEWWGLVLAGRPGRRREH